MNKKLKLLAIFLVMNIIFMNLPAQFMTKAMAADYEKDQIIPIGSILNAGDTIVFDGNGTGYIKYKDKNGIDSDAKTVDENGDSKSGGEIKIKMPTQGYVWQVTGDMSWYVDENWNFGECPMDDENKSRKKLCVEEVPATEIIGESEGDGNVTVGTEPSEISVNLTHANYDTIIETVKLEKDTDSTESDFEITDSQIETQITTDAAVTVKVKLKSAEQVGTYTDNLRIIDINGTISTVQISQTVVEKRTRPKPEGLGYVYSNNQGTIKPVTTEMQYKKSTDAEYKSVTEEMEANGITGLVPGEYWIRYAATDDYNESDPEIIKIVASSSSGSSSSGSHHKSSSSSSDSKVVMQIGDSSLPVTILSKETYGSIVVGNNLSNIGLTDLSIISLYGVNTAEFKGYIAILTGVIKNADGTSTTANYIYVKCENAESEKSIKFDVSNLNKDLPAYAYKTDGLENVTLVQTINPNVLLQNNNMVELQPKSGDNYIISDNKVTEKTAQTVNETVVQGWDKAGSNWRYIKDGKAVTGWAKDTDGKWYYMDSYGIMQKDWVKDNGKWYYLNNSGAMETGWIKDKSEKWYLLGSSGAMITGWYQDADGKWYYLNNDGSMAVNTSINGYNVGTDGAWIK